MTIYAIIIINKNILDETTAFLIIEEKRIFFINSNLSSRHIITHWLGLCYNRDIEQTIQ